ncbi:hypothetical protein [[Mycoplasma] collis]|uniref:hypothetical protein n=1 Tax=[Mycoplasma] collis TaxID=2127 RepID=UPI00051B0096|nr:hypothetical protein [[Mycoplasma] collis]
MEEKNYKYNTFKQNIKKLFFYFLTLTFFSLSIPILMTLSFIFSIKNIKSTIYEANIAILIFCFALYLVTIIKFFDFFIYTSYFSNIIKEKGIISLEDISKKFISKRLLKRLLWVSKNLNVLEDEVYKFYISKDIVFFKKRE